LSKKLKIVAALITSIPLLFIGLFALLSEQGSSYHFGIEVERYRDKVGKIEEYAPINENVNTYSWMTPLVLPNTKDTIQIEHLVRAYSYDKALHPEISEDFLMTMVQVDSAQIIAVAVDNIVDGEPLQPIMEKLYRLSANSDSWEVDRINNPNNLISEKSYTAIGLFYSMPQKHGPDFWGIEKFLFQNAVQKITIRYLNDSNSVQIYTIEFDLHWYCNMSGFQKFMTVT